MVSPATTARIVAKAIARDEGEEDVAAEALRQQRRAHVGAAVRGDEAPCRRWSPRRSPGTWS